jgi:hypothetical protein
MKGQQKASNKLLLHWRGHDQSRPIEVLFVAVEQVETKRHFLCVTSFTAKGRITSNKISQPFSFLEKCPSASSCSGQRPPSVRSGSAASPFPPLLSGRTGLTGPGAGCIHNCQKSLGPMDGSMEKAFHMEPGRRLLSCFSSRLKTPRTGRRHSLQGQTALTVVSLLFLLLLLYFFFRGDPTKKNAPKRPISP